MRRSAVRFLMTLAVAVSILGVVPATSEAGIIPWAWDTLFGPVGSIQARHAGYACNDCGTGYTASYAGSYYGPAPRFVGFRGWRNRACCGTAGYASGYGCSSCGNSCGTGCATGCSSCGSGCSSCGTGYDSGYIYGSGGCGPGGCATGQCNVNYGTGVQPGVPSATSPVTPAPMPGAGGPSPNYDNQGPATNNNVIPPAAPGAATDDGFVPAGKNKSPAPPTGDPTKEEYIPPKVNPTDAPASGVDANGNSTTVPPVGPGPETPAKKKPVLSDDDEKGGSIGPRFELDQKVTWRPSVLRVRQAQTPVRVTASARRTGAFPKIAWRSGVETELAKK